MASVEGVWAKDIEEAFEEALAVYPPCGRRKIILSDEGKMYGRNELIARYIKMRTGKTRTRKQVSSHIQVLSRKRGRESDKGKTVSSVNTNMNSRPSPAPPPPLPMNRTGLPISGMTTPPAPLQAPVFPSSLQSIAQPSSPGTFNYPPPPTRPQFIPPYLNEQTKKPISDRLPVPHQNSLIYSPIPAPSAQVIPKINHGPQRTSLCELSVFLEPPAPTSSYHLFAELKDVDFAGPHDRVDIRQMYHKVPGLQQLYMRGPRDSMYLVKLCINLNTPTFTGFFGVTTKYHSGKSTSVKCSSKVFEHGKQVVEQIQVEYPLIDNGSYCYFYNRTPLCEFAVNFLARAREAVLVSRGGQMEASEILSYVAVLQTLTDRDTQENLLTLLYIFEAGDSQLNRRVYKLSED